MCILVLVVGPAWAMVTTCGCVLWACAQTLSATDFYEALGRVADMKWLPTARDLEVLGVTNCYDFFARMRGAATAVAVYPHAIQHACSPVLPHVGCVLQASGVVDTRPCSAAFGSKTSASRWCAA